MPWYKILEGRFSKAVRKDLENYTPRYAPKNFMDKLDRLEGSLQAVKGCQHVPALQLLQAERTEQEAEIARLRAENKHLEAIVRQLENRLAELEDENERILEAIS